MNSKWIAALEVPGTVCTVFDSKNSSDARRPGLKIHHWYTLNHSHTPASKALKPLHKTVKISPFHYGRAPAGSDKHNALSSWCKEKKISSHPAAEAKNDTLQRYWCFLWYYQVWKSHCSLLLSPSYTHTYTHTFQQTHTHKHLPANRLKNSHIILAFQNKPLSVI